MTPIERRGLLIQLRPYFLSRSRIERQLERDANRARTVAVAPGPAVATVDPPASANKARGHRLKHGLNVPTRVLVENAHNRHIRALKAQAR